VQAAVQLGHAEGARRLVQAVHVCVMIQVSSPSPAQLGTSAR